jgi:hypothetical protein
MCTPQAQVLAIAAYRASVIISQSANNRAALIQAFLSTIDIRLMRAFAVFDIFT